MLRHRQAIFESKGDKLSSSAESRVRTQCLRHLFASRLNACWQTDWANEDQAKNLNSTARPYIKLRLQCFSRLVSMIITYMNSRGNVNKSGKILNRYIHLFAARQDELLRSTTDPEVIEDIKSHPVRISFAAFEHSSLFVSTRVPASEVKSSVIAASIHGYIVSHKSLNSGTNPSSLQQVNMKFRTHQVKCPITGAYL